MQDTMHSILPVKGLFLLFLAASTSLARQSLPLLWADLLKEPDFPEPRCTFIPVTQHPLQQGRAKDPLELDGKMKEQNNP